MAVQPVLRPLSLKEANQQFSRLIREVENGEAFVITRRGRPIARILPNDDVRTGDPIAFRVLEGAMRHPSPDLGAPRAEPARLLAPSPRPCSRVLLRNSSAP